MFRWQIHDIEDLGTEPTEALRNHAMALGAGLHLLRDRFLSGVTLSRWSAAGRSETAPKTTSSRSVLETTILPFYRRSNAHRSLLFVGCDQHTAGYERLFATKTFRTLDGDAERAHFGAARHQVAPMRNMVFLLSRESVDAIICNAREALGESPADAEAACEAALRTLRPGGHLIVVMNDPEPESSFRLDDIEALHKFAPLDFPPLKTTEPAATRAARRHCRFYKKPA
jgi:SAM-dependent methyltransferase